MSRDLMRAFFERDLSVDEMSQVAKNLENDDDDAAFFAVLAAAHYGALGLPRPNPGGGSGLGPWGLAGLGLVVGVALTTAYWWTRTEMPEPSTQLLPAATGTTLPTVIPVPKQKKVGIDEGDDLKVQVDLPRRIAITVDVFTAQGRRVKRLYEGEAGPGEALFAFDGLDKNGEAVPPGRYQVIVDYGNGKSEKWLTIGR